MKYENRYVIIVVFYTLFLLILCVGAVFMLKDTPLRELDITETFNNEGNTDVVYIPIYVETTESITEQTTVESNIFSWIIRSYEGKIGVFSSDGNLARVIEVYIKTLPATDRRLLEEGIVVNDETELRSIIEDYS